MRIVRHCLGRVQNLAAAHANDDVTIAHARNQTVHFMFAALAPKLFKDQRGAVKALFDRRLHALFARSADQDQRLLPQRLHVCAQMFEFSFALHVFAGRNDDVGHVLFSP